MTLAEDEDQRDSYHCAESSRAFDGRGLESPKSLHDNPGMRAILALLVWVGSGRISVSSQRPSPEVTPATHGPYRIVRNTILDAGSRPFLVRGTHTAQLRDDSENDDGFDPLSGTALVTIRHRLNMNAVRVALDPGRYLSSEKYRGRVDRLIRSANDLGLLVIVEASSQADDSLNRFWSLTAARLRSEPDVFFAPLARELIATIRNAGATQPVIIEAKPGGDKGVVYQLTPHYAGSQAIWSRMQGIARKAPVLADDFDPHFENANGECASFPADPEQATRLVQSKLDWFDQHKISWTLSSFTIGHLVTDYWGFNGTKLDDGWTCGKPQEIPVGLGLVLLSHLWHAPPLGLFVVSHSRGGIELARGGIAAAYGPTLADQDMQAQPPLPAELGNISVRISDSRGVTRLAPMLHAAAGWSQVNFIVPAECAPGPASLAIIRKDGSSSERQVLIRDIAPALLTAAADGRGAAVAFVSQTGAGVEAASVPAWTCQSGCRTVPISLASGVSTTVRLIGSGFRYVHDKASLRAITGGIEVPVESVAPSDVPGNDQLTIRVPDELIGVGEVELYVRADRELSNVVTINFGRR
jgi:uncharacterized protein (TIGR03437 family)